MNGLSWVLILVAVPEGTLALPETSVIGVENFESAWGPVEGYTATRTAAGMNYFVSKPLTPGSLLQALSQVLTATEVESAAA